MSFPEQAFDLDQIFVGRHHELRILSKLWKKALEPGEHLVYVMLNAPGTGKTRLLQHFGQQLERENQGLFFPYRCDGHHLTATALHQDLVEKLSEVLISRNQYIEQYINASYPTEEEMHYRKKQLERVKERIATIQTRENIVTLSVVASLMQQLSLVIPVFFVADEIQEFQKVTLKVDEPSLQNEENDKETILHYLTRILKSLMTSRILMILSGTQYHILSQIGTKIGSPIAQKVEQLIIRNFNHQELDDYAEEVRGRFLNEMTPSEKIQVSSQLLSHYRRFLQAFSGGHPRTVVLITKWFLTKYHYFLERNPSRNEFMESLFSAVETDFKARIFTSEQQEQIRQLQASKHFSLVKNWLLERAFNGFKLGAEPTVPQSDRESVADLVYKLMTLGVITQNGMNQYYLTSYFHLLAFLECFTGEHELFLQQVLTNRFFRLMCGSHSGFGYTFEHVLLAAIMLKNYRLPSRTLQEVIPFSLTNVTRVQEISGENNWKDLEIEHHVLYHVPRASNIDMFFFEGEQLVLVQVTTATHSHRDKMTALARAVEEASSAFPDKDVMGWYISLFPVPDSEARKWSASMVITAGESLKHILGNALFQRLLNVKKQLKQDVL